MNLPLLRRRVVNRDGNRDRIAARVGGNRRSARQVVHHELPAPAEVPSRKRHHGVDGQVLAQQRAHPAAVPDEQRLNGRVDVILVDHAPDARSGRRVDVGEHPVEGLPVDLEPDRVQVRVEHEVSNPPGPAVLVVFLARHVEVLEAPVIHQVRVALDQIPDGVHVRDNLDDRGHALDRLARGARENLVGDAGLEHVHHHLRGRDVGRNARGGHVDQVARLGEGEGFEAGQRAEPVETRDAEHLVAQAVAS